MRGSFGWGGWGWLGNIFKTKSIREKQIEQQKKKEYRKGGIIPQPYIEKGTRSQIKQRTMHSHRRK